MGPRNQRKKNDPRYEQASRLDSLGRLKFWRNRREPDLSLASLPAQFERDFARPFKRLAAIYPIWCAVLGENLTNHTKLESLNHGILRATIDSTAIHYEIDRILRSGGERQIIVAYRRGTLRNIKLRVGSIGLAPQYENTNVI